MPDRVGQLLGNYRLTRLLGEGGFAEVYLGEHVYLNTQAAIKVMHARVANDDLEGFLREARIIARLEHPHIVRVLEFGVENKIPFLAMNYAPNGSLRQNHPKGVPLPLVTIISYVKQLADALQYAHDEKLIHRDVKPENMLLDRRGEILLSDFGIALVAQSSHYQSTQGMAGTMPYMAPEQIQGKPRPVSDQYALGIVVYEWISGDRPFQGSFTELVGQHLSAPPPSLLERVQALAPDIEQVVFTALAKDPKERFASVQAFATSLEQAYQSTQFDSANVLPNLSSLSHEVITPLVQSSQLSPSTLPPLLPSLSGAITPLPGSSLSMKGGHSSKASSIEALPEGKTIVSRGPDGKLKIWSIEVIQIGYMAFGASIYEALSKLSTTLDLSKIVSFLGYFPLFPAIVIPMFFGATFGPWIGTFTGGLGAFMVYFIFGYPVAWQEVLGVAMIGFIAGLAMPTTGGRYNNVRAILIAEIFSAIGVILGFGISACYVIWFLKHSIKVVSQVYIGTVLADLMFGLILLPLLLIASNMVIERRRRA